MPLLIDALLPDADAAEHHATRVRAPAPVVWRALWHAELGGPPARLLMTLRLLPAALAGPGNVRARLRALRAPPGMTLAGVRESAFTVLGERAGAEVVLGLTGRFWRPDGGLVPTDARGWAAGPPPGAAQAAWSFTVTPRSATETLLATATRVRCADPAARRAFRAYWLLVRPFSGLLRRLMLRTVRRAAERDAAAGG